jgi:hypothetical protein
MHPGPAAAHLNDHSTPRQSITRIEFSARTRRHLETVLRVYTHHYNRERPHRGLALLPPDPTTAEAPLSHGEIKRRDRLGGLIHEYHRAAA